MHLPGVHVLNLGTRSGQSKPGGCPSQGLGVQFRHAPGSCELALALAATAGFRTSASLLTGLTLGTLESSSARPEILCMEVRDGKKGNSRIQNSTILYKVCPFSQQQTEPMSMAQCLLMQSSGLGEHKRTCSCISLPSSFEATSTLQLLAGCGCCWLRNNVK